MKLLSFKLGSFPPLALRAVLFTAYVAFFLGAATYYFVVRRYFRKFSRSRLELLGKRGDLYLTRPEFATDLKRRTFG